MKLRGWRKRHAAADSGPAELLEAIRSRKLSDLDRCRIAWQEADDPMALAVAVTQADLPEWLADALLRLLVLDDDDAGKSRHPLSREWRDRARDMTDCHRATAAASARQLALDEGITWDLAYRLGEQLVRERFDDVGPVTPDAVKKSYQAVEKGISNRGRYHLPPATFLPRYLAALEREANRLRAKLAQMTSRPPRKRGTKATH
jgi:hypothetical protein